MRRRDLLAGLGGLAVVGTGAVYVTQSNTGETVEPVTVERLDESGAVAGEMTVPQPAQPTVLTVFATWCSTCRRTMPAVVEVSESVDEVAFLSVSNEAIGQTTTREDVADWWADHGGDWPVGVDSSLDLTAAFDVRGVPTTIVFDEDGRIQYDERGEKTADELRSALPEE